MRWRRDVFTSRLEQRVTDSASVVERTAKEAWQVHQES
jgi:hypothetical protein